MAIMMAGHGRWQDHRARIATNRPRLRTGDCNHLDRFRKQRSFFFQKLLALRTSFSQVMAADLNHGHLFLSHHAAVQSYSDQSNGAVPAKPHLHHR